MSIVIAFAVGRAGRRRSGSGTDTEETHPAVVLAHHSLCPWGKKLLPQLDATPHSGGSALTVTAITGFVPRSAEPLSAADHGSPTEVTNLGAPADNSGPPPTQVTNLGLPAQFGPTINASDQLGRSGRQSTGKVAGDMFAEPADLDRELLRAALASGWGINEVPLEYHPVGFGTHHYLARTRSVVWFVNVDDLAAKPTGAEQGFDDLDRALRTALALRRRPWNSFTRRSSAKPVACWIGSATTRCRCRSSSMAPRIPMGSTPPPRSAAGTRAAGPDARNERPRSDRPAPPRITGSAFPTTTLRCPDRTR